MDSDEQRIGDYRITELLGENEIGQSYLAEQDESGRPCVVRVLHEELAKDKHFGERFRGVARAIGDLVHRRIVAVGEMRRAEGQYYVAMAYVAGPRGKPMSLKEYLAYRRVEGDGTVQNELVRVWGIQIAEALAFAHDNGHMHHSLRPGKVLIDSDNNVQVSGFGLARAVGEEFLYARIFGRMQTRLVEALSRPRAPYTGAEPGPYDYLAPEQRYAAQVDERADIYAFGVLLYRMLTGRGPGSFAQPPSQLVDGISPQWDAVVRKCLAENPTDRYPSAKALHRAIKNLDRQVPPPVPGQDEDVVELHVASLEADVAAAAAASAVAAAARAGEVPQFRRVPRGMGIFAKIGLFVVVFALASAIVWGPKLAKQFTKSRTDDPDTADKQPGDDQPGTSDVDPIPRGGKKNSSELFGPLTPGRSDKPPRKTGKPPRKTEKPPRKGGSGTIMDALRNQAQGSKSPAVTKARLIAPRPPKTPRESAVAKMKRVSAMSTRTPDAIARSFMDPSRLKRTTRNSSARKAFYSGLVARDPADKIKHYTKAIQLDEQYAWAYVQRGFAYFFDRQYREALADYTKAIELDGDDYVPYYCRALTFEKLGKKQEAQHDYSRAEQRAPKDPAWHIQRGNDHVGNGKHADAIGEYTKAIKLNPKIALAYNNRGVVYSETGQYTEALTDLTRAVTLDTGSFRAYFNRGLTYLRMKRYDEAIRDNTTALGIESRNAKAYYNRACAYEKKGMTAEAQRDFEEARNIVAPGGGSRLFD